MPKVRQKYPDGTLYSDEPYALDGSVEIIGTVVLGKNVAIGKGTKLNNVVIGDGCDIGKECKIRNTVMWENVAVGKHALLDGCVICNSNTIGKNVTAKAGMILAEGVITSYSIHYTKLYDHRWQ